MKISVIITSYNTLSLIQKSLPVIIQSSPQADEFIFIDDASTDGSAQYAQSLTKQYPRLKVISQSENHGFSYTSNTAVKAATGDLVVLLNSDIFPEDGYLIPALKHFSDPLVFGVGLCEKGRRNYARIYWQDGYLQHEPQTSDQTHISAWISGGSSIVRRDLFLTLGGFDEIYSPFYFEDLDLGIRVWKSGLKLLWEPKAIVVHNHGTSTSKLPKRFVSYVKERNHLLTVIRNITDPKLIFQNKLAQIFRVLTGPNYIKIILAAHRQLKKYPQPVHLNKLTDLEVLNIFK